MKILIIITGIIAIIALVLLFALYKFQEKLIFFPEKLSPDYKFSFTQKVEEINFETEKGVVINSLLFFSDSSNGLILYFHGNAGALNSWGEIAKDFPTLDDKAVRAVIAFAAASAEEDLPVPPAPSHV